MTSDGMYWHRPNFAREFKDSLQPTINFTIPETGVQFSGSFLQSNLLIIALGENGLKIVEVLNLLNLSGGLVVANPRGIIFMKTYNLQFFEFQRVRNIEN